MTSQTPHLATQKMALMVATTRAYLPIPIPTVSSKTDLESNNQPYQLTLLPSHRPRTRPLPRPPPRIHSPRPRQLHPIQLCQRHRLRRCAQLRQEMRPRQEHPLHQHRRRAQIRFRGLRIRHRELWLAEQRSRLLQYHDVQQY